MVSLTAISLRFHFRPLDFDLVAISSVSLQFRLDVTRMSLRCHFYFTSISFRCAAASLRFHIESTSMETLHVSYGMMPHAGKWSDFLSAFSIL